MSGRRLRRQPPETEKRRNASSNHNLYRMTDKRGFTLRTVLQSEYGILLLLTLLLPGALHAQVQRTPKGDRSLLRTVTARGRVWSDSLSNLVEDFEHWKYTGADSLSNPYYFPLLVPHTFYEGATSRSLGTTGLREDFLGIGRRMSTIDGALLWLYTRYPWAVELWAKAEPADSVQQAAEELPENALAEDWITAGPMENADSLTFDTPLPIVVRKPNFWKLSSSFSLQFMQNYLTDNWYKGGERYNSLQASLTSEANYDNKRKVIFNNKLEMKLGFQSSRNDETHRYKTNSDQVRLTNKLGLRATDHWYYTFLLQSWTQFCRGYKSNDDNVYSDFMSPFESVFSIGMDYNLSVKNFTLTATMSPLACDFKYVGRKALATSFGVDEGHHTKWELGSNVTINYKWTVFKNVNWSGRIYYYTNYKKAQIEWENTIDFVINRFLTSRLFLYPRFDDSVARSEDGSYFQFNETLSIGLNVSF